MVKWQRMTITGYSEWIGCRSVHLDNSIIANCVPSGRSLGRWSSVLNNMQIFIATLLLLNHSSQSIIPILRLINSNECDLIQLELFLSSSIIITLFLRSLRFLLVLINPPFQGNLFICSNLNSFSWKHFFN